MAILTPPLILATLISVDFGRVYYYTDILSNCARNGAMWASDSTAQAISPYTTVTQAALADAPDFGSQPTVSTPVKGTDSAGNSYYSVTVSFNFSTIVPYPGMPPSMTLSRTVEMRVAPSYNY